jgi:RHS repeat-associated protein
MEVARDQTFARVSYGEPGVSTPGFLPEVHWLLTDHLNSVRLVLDENGAVLDQIAYDAFGNIVAQLNPLFDNPILFTSREFDAETGLYFNRARYLDPTTGRWTTQDPLGFAAGDTNLYRYVGNTPTLLVDPSGNIVWLPILLFGGAALITGTSVAVNFGLPEYIGNNNPQWAGSSSDYFGRWAHRVERRTVSGLINHNIVGIPDGFVESVTILGAPRYRSVSFGQPGHTSSYWQYVFRGRLGMWVGRVFLHAFWVEGLIDGVVIIEAGIESIFH